MTITLDHSHPAVQHLCTRDKRLAKLIDMVGTITYEPHRNDDIYPFLIHEIIEQMLSIKAGLKIYGHLEDLCAGKVTPERVASLTDDEIRSIGTSASKARCIRTVTDAVLSGGLDLDRMDEMSDDEVMQSLTRIKGIGKWTAKMFLIFVLDRPDVLPVEDGAFLQTYRWLYKTDDVSAKNVYNKCRKRKPYSSIAVRYFYYALNLRLTKEEFHLYK